MYMCSLPWLGSGIGAIQDHGALNSTGTGFCRGYNQLRLPNKRRGTILHAVHHHSRCGLRMIRSTTDSPFPIFAELVLSCQADMTRRLP